RLVAQTFRIRRSPCRNTAVSARCAGSCGSILPLPVRIVRGNLSMNGHSFGASSAVPLAPAMPVLRDRRGRVYEPAIGPRLKVLLFIIFGGVAIVGASGVYLLSISFLEWLRAPRVYATGFSLWMLIVHVFIGVVLAAPFVIFGTIHLATARKRKNKRAVRLGICVFMSGLIV